MLRIVQQRGFNTEFEYIKIGVQGMLVKSYVVYMF